VRRCCRDCSNHRSRPTRVPSTCSSAASPCRSAIAIKGNKLVNHVIKTGPFLGKEMCLSILFYFHKRN
jgi:hypothetical protein